MNSTPVSRAVLLVAALALFGAGCSLPFGRPRSPEIPPEMLKQPAPAKAPTKAPEIPPEAANVPRPY